MEGGVDSPFMRALFALVSLLALAGLVSTARGDDSTAPKPKGSSFAPHRGGSHVYGTPIQRPILHKRHKPAKAPSKASPTPPPR